MKEQKAGVAQKICIIAGVCLLVIATALLIFWRWNVVSAQQEAAGYVQTLRTLIPNPRDAVPEERRDNAMSVLSIDGKDFVGIIELPRYGSALPVCADWGNTSRYPCRFSGSIYNGTMQIGGTTQEGQYDFYRELSVGDRVVFTDMEGNRYTYQVTALRTAEHVDQAALGKEPAALTLFIQNIYSFEYLIVFCNSK